MHLLGVTLQLVVVREGVGQHAGATENGYAQHGDDHVQALAVDEDHGEVHLRLEFGFHACGRRRRWARSYAIFSTRTTTVAASAAPREETP